MTEQTTKDREAARLYVQTVVISDFGQEIDEETLDQVVEKVLRAVPPYSKAENIHT